MLTALLFGLAAATAVLLAAAVVVGNAALSSAGEKPLSFLLSLAGGADPRG